MAQGKYKPPSGKTILQAGARGIFVAVVFGLMVAGVPSWSKTWFIISLVLGFLFTIFAILIQFEFAKRNMVIKFMLGWLFIMYMTMISIHSLSYFFSNVFLGVFFPAISVVLTGLAAFFKVTEKLPDSTQGKLRILADRINKLALALISVAGVLGASFGGYMAKTGQVHFAALVVGVMAYILSLAITYSVFKQFLKELMQNGNN